MIDIEHISKHYVVDGRDIPAITDINLRIEQGEIFGIIGASGAGKSTLIRTLNLLESNADVTIADIAAGMQGLAHLITCYPSDIGNESIVLPQVGRLLRVLGDALEFTQDAAHTIADRQWAHERLAATGQAPS